MKEREGSSVVSYGERMKGVVGGGMGEEREVVVGDGDRVFH